MNVVDLLKTELDESDTPCHNVSGDDCSVNDVEWVLTPTAANGDKAPFEMTTRDGVPLAVPRKNSGR